MSNYPYDDPDIGYDDGEDYCDHEDYEADIVTGDATCCHCNHRWIMTIEQVNAEIDRQREYDEWQRDMERPSYRIRRWFRDRRDDIRWRWQRLWKPKPTCLDDEIPF